MSSFLIDCITAGAMRALQQKGIVHRDLKPQNILLSHAGKPNPQPNDIRLKIGMFRSRCLKTYQCRNLEILT